MIKPRKRARESKEGARAKGTGRLTAVIRARGITVFSSLDEVWVVKVPIYLIERGVGWPFPLVPSQNVYLACEE